MPKLAKVRIQVRQNIGKGTSDKGKKDRPDRKSTSDKDKKGGGALYNF